MKVQTTDAPPPPDPADKLQQMQVQEVTAFLLFSIVGGQADQKAAWRALSVSERNDYRKSAWQIITALRTEAGVEVSARKKAVELGTFIEELMTHPAKPAYAIEELQSS